MRGPPKDFYNVFTLRAILREKKNLDPEEWERRKAIRIKNVNALREVSCLFAFVSGLNRCADCLPPFVRKGYTSV